MLTWEGARAGWRGSAHEHDGSNESALRVSSQETIQGRTGRVEVRSHVSADDWSTRVVSDGKRGGDNR